MDSDCPIFMVKFVPIMGDIYDSESKLTDVEIDRPETLSDTIIPRKKKTTYVSIP